MGEKEHGSWEGQAGELRYFQGGEERGYSGQGGNTVFGGGTVLGGEGKGRKKIRSVGVGTVFQAVVV